MRYVFERAKVQHVYANYVQEEHQEEHRADPEPTPTSTPHNGGPNLDDF